jgi:hypothetical protein
MSEGAMKRCRRGTARLLWWLARRWRWDQVSTFRASFERASGRPYDPDAIERWLQGGGMVGAASKEEGRSEGRTRDRVRMLYRYRCPACGRIHETAVYGAFHKNVAMGWWEFMPELQEAIPLASLLSPPCPACGQSMRSVRTSWVWPLSEGDR